jgi:tetratricopeptide (TPR) repeat protein
MRNIAPVIALVLLVAVAYCNILGNRFTNWDDNHLIVLNKAIRSLDPVFILKNFHISYPPLNVISHGIDHLFWGLNPVGYHITDIFLYALIVASFFLICEKILGDRSAAVAAAALFAVHPLHVESVAWLSSRKDGLGMLSYLLAFLAYLRGREQKQYAYLWLSSLFYFCALWSKPLMATLPLALILYDILPGRSRTPVKLGELIVTKLPYAVPLAATALTALTLDPHNEIGLRYHGGSAYATFLAMVIVLPDYLRMLLLPVGLNALYVVRIPGGLMNLPCLLSLAVLLLAAASALTSARKLPLLAFTVLWGVVSLLPVMQIVPVNIVKADRYLYLPTAALCLLYGGVLHALRPRRVGVAIAVLAAVTLLSVLTIARNTVWRDSVSLWEAVIMRDPSNADAYNNLGIALASNRDYAGAEQILKQALRLRTDFPSASNNLANVYRITGRYDMALDELQKAAGLARDIVYAASAYLNMGMVYEARGEYDKALDAYGEASRLNPVYLDDSALMERIAACRRMKGERPSKWAPFARSGGQGS